MNKDYLKLFQELTSTVSVLAEQVMDYNEKHDDNNGVKNAEVLHTDFNAF